MTWAADIGEQTAGGIPGWFTQILVTVASALIIAAVLWLVRRAGRIRSTWVNLKATLLSIDQAVNQREKGKPKLIEVADSVSRRLIAIEKRQLLDAARLLKIDRQIADRPTYEQILEAAVVLHPDLDVDELNEVVHGDAPPLTSDEIETLRVQAREIARRRIERDGPDNPEEHP